MTGPGGPNRVGTFGARGAGYCFLLTTTSATWVL